MELAPGPKELMNMQRFYLYLNLTKPKEQLCLSYSQSNGRGEASSPAFLLHTIKRMFPKLNEVRADQPESQMELLETPETSIEYLLEGLTEENTDELSPVFRELYSWYLRSPKYRPLAEKLTDAVFLRKPEDKISESVAKALYGEVSPHGATRLERFSACAFAHFL